MSKPAKSRTALTDGFNAANVVGCLLSPVMPRVWPSCVLPNWVATDDIHIGQMLFSKSSKTCNMKITRQFC